MFLSCLLKWSWFIGLSQECFCFDLSTNSLWNIGSDSLGAVGSYPSLNQGGAIKPVKEEWWQACFQRGIFIEKIWWRKAEVKKTKPGATTTKHTHKKLWGTPKKRWNAQII